MQTQESVPAWASVDRWISRLAPVTGRKEEQRFKTWMKWFRQSGTKFADFTPDQLIQHQIDAVNTERYEILDEIVQPWIRSKKARWSTKHRYYTTIRSFFKHNRAPLPDDPDFIIRADREPVEGELKPEVIRDVVLSSKPRYRAVFLAMFMGAMDEASFEHWNLNGWEATKRQLDEGEDIIRIDLPGRKRTRNVKSFYTLIGGDAVKALRNYVGHHRPRGVTYTFPEGHPREGETVTPIFLGRFKDPINADNLYHYWLHHLREVGHARPSVPREEGGIRHRTGKNPHEMRDTFRSLWEKSPVKGSIAEFMMGHQVDPLLYNKAHRDEAWVRREYRKALPMLEIMSSGRPFGMVAEDEVEALRRRVQELEERKAGLPELGEEAQEAIAEFVSLLGRPGMRDKFLSFLRGLAEEKA